MLMLFSWQSLKIFKVRTDYDRTCLTLTLSDYIASLQCVVFAIQWQFLKHLRAVISQVRIFQAYSCHRGGGSGGLLLLL